MEVSSVLFYLEGELIVMLTSEMSLHNNVVKIVKLTLKLVSILLKGETSPMKNELACLIRQTVYSSIYSYRGPLNRSHPGKRRSRRTRRIKEDDVEQKEWMKKKEKIDGMEM